MSKSSLTAIFSIIALLVIAVILFSIPYVTGNKTMFDTNYNFTKAIIVMEGEKTEVDITTWVDFDNSDMMQVTSTDGTVYLTHSDNILLISE